MDFAEYERLKQFEERYWWHVGRRFILEELLKKYLFKIRSLRHDSHKLQILDVGCGTGGSSLVLSRFGKLTGLDNSELALKLAVGANFSDLVLGEITNLPFKDDIFDCLSVLDVLEHISDREDSIAIKECWRVLKADGLIVIAVPVYQWLWSGHDEALGHKRRYTLGKLVCDLEAGGFEIVFKSYIVSFLAPLIFTYRLLERILRHKQQTSYVLFPKIIDDIFATSLRIEAFFIKIGIRFPFGVSAVVLATKSISTQQ